MNAKVLVGVGLAFVVGVFVFNTKTEQIEKQDRKEKEKIELQDRNDKENAKQKKENCKSDYKKLLDEHVKADRTWPMHQIKATPANNLILRADLLSKDCPDLTSELAAFKQSVLDNKDE